MHHRTAWANSSLPSDRIKPRPSGITAKSKAKSPEEPKSEAVLRLEKQLKALQSTSGKDKDPKGGCFCLAREHQLSTYTPVCLHCGLVLCLLNLPHFCCPHCLDPLLTETQRSALESRIESEITQTLAKEALAREQALERARQEAGAFPALVSQHSGATAKPTNQGHVVISLSSKTKKATPIPSASKNTSPKESEDDGLTRVPPPSSVPLLKRNLDPARPWLNLTGEEAKYIAPGQKSGKRRKP